MGRSHAGGAVGIPGVGTSEIGAAKLLQSPGFKTTSRSFAANSLERETKGRSLDRSEITLDMSRFLWTSPNPRTA
jgi:hypothetical protein